MVSRQQPHCRFDPADILRQRGGADLDLHMREAEVRQAPYFLRQSRRIIGRIMVTAAGVDGYAARFARSIADELCQQTIERDLSDLRRGIPERHVERTDGNAALTVTARLLALHHYRPGPEGVEVRSVVVGEVGVAGAQQARRKSLPDEAALGKPPDRGEPIADNGAA